MGAGWYAAVAACITKEGKDIAVKQIVEHPQVFWKEIENAFYILKRLEEGTDPRKEHIIKAIAWGSTQGRPALAMELITPSNILTRMREGRYVGHNNEKEMKDVGNQVLDGLVYMHSKRIAHGDIHVGNVAFAGDTAKWIDFDAAFKDKDYVNRVEYGQVGSAAPEGLRPPDGDYDNRRIDPYANDVWTTAAMFVRMTTNKMFPRTDEDEMQPIWSDDDRDSRVRKIQTQWPDFTLKFAQLLGDLFCKEAQRINADQFKHRFENIQIY